MSNNTPDMLAALRRIAPYLMKETSPEPGPEYEHYHASKAVREAIAKAEKNTQFPTILEMLEILKRIDTSWSKDLPDGPDTLPRDGIRIWPEHADIWRKIRAVIASTSTWAEGEA